MEIRIADAFGLVELGRSFSSRTTLVVTPKVVPLPRAVVSGSWLGDGDGRARAAAAAGEDDVVPRAYRDGDELRRVHWRSTARYGELMVRREEQQWRNRVLLLLDTRRAAHVGSGATSSFEFAVSAAASIGTHLAREGLEGQLITDAGALTAPGIFEDLLLNSLAVIKPSRSRELDAGIAALRGCTGLTIAVAGRLSAGAAPPPAPRRPAPGPPPAPPPPPPARGPARGPGRPAAGAQRGNDAGSRRVNPRLTLTAAAAVILASVSIYPLIQGGAWFWAGVGAVIIAAAAGTVTRLPTVQAAVGATVLALIAASPLLFNPAWPWKLLGVAVVAAAAASRPRIRILQVLGGLITYLAALLIYLNVAFAARLSVAGIVPTTTSLRHLWSLADQGLAERAFAPPVSGSLGITLLTAGGIGLMGAATDLLAVRLRSPAIAGLPLLALYSVRITTNARQGGAGATLVFCLGMIGYLA